MQKIMFNDRYGLTKAVLKGQKTMTRRLVPLGTPFGNWEDTEKKSRYKVGEVVAVAQSYKDLVLWKHEDREIDLEIMRETPGWNNKMFVSSELMPHKIRITGVRVERLQDISDEDCLREGVQKEGPYAYYIHGKDDILGLSAKGVFSILIDKISGKGAWESNPFVFVYEFVLLKED